MNKTNDSIDSKDIFNLNRFYNAQATTYQGVLRELKNGRKQSHWMWYIFPQLDGLGKSETAKFYAIKSIREAVAYLNHPILGARLLECANTLLEINNKTAREIFGYPDDLKLKSSMTLFSEIAPKSVFVQVLDQYFQSQRDLRSLLILEQLK
ncbi:hypothetical protein NIES4102_01710 [Chondrocystis sp. NIES-4102]|nr:hypothetical protein NIES4102_01710 [Chondrocystis sp. NIES-4102]